MSIDLASITFDCDDALAVATFWSAALDAPLDPDGSADFASIGVSGSASLTPSWMFSRVPEGKTAKNRMHVDLTAADRRAEVDRLIGLGAKPLRDVEEWGHSWTVLQDPEGNEFCVAQTQAVDRD
jgi:Glyoxalase-like domain